MMSPNEYAEKVANETSRLVTKLVHLYKDQPYNTQVNLLHYVNSELGVGVLILDDDTKSGRL